jgi:hypothetical protein
MSNPLTIQLSADSWSYSKMLDPEQTISIPRHDVKTAPGNACLMAGKLKQPRVITDHCGEPVCILATGYCFNDQRWNKIWQCHEEKGETLVHDDLRELFPDEPASIPRTR